MGRNGGGGASGGGGDGHKCDSGSKALGICSCYARAAWRKEKTERWEARPPAA